MATAAKWGTAIVGGATAAVGAVSSFATKTAETTDTIDKMSQRLGLSRESYQELDFALSQSGVDIQSFQTGAKSLLAQMDKVTEGNSTAIENFAKLGIEVTDADGKLKNQNDIMFETINAFQQMENSAEKSRLAQELFGKQGQEILPLLNSEAGSLDAMRQQAHELGLVLDDETIDAGVNLTDVLDQTKRALSSMGTQLGGAVMPIVTKALEYVQKMLPQIQALIQKLEPVFTSVLDNLLPPLFDLAETLLPVLFDLAEKIIPPLTQMASAILPVFVTLLETFLPPLIQIVSALLPVLLNLLTPLLNLLTPLLALLQPVLDLVTALIAPIADIINELLPPVIEFITNLIEAVLPLLQDALKSVANVIKTVFNVAIAAIKPVIEGVVFVFSNAWKTVSTIWGVAIDFFGGIWNGIKTVFSGVWDFFSTIFGGLFDIIKAPLNFVIDALNVLIDGLNVLSFDIPSWIPIIGGQKFGFDISKIPHLKNGGMVDGDLFVANEEEPELIATNHDSTVVVNNKQIIAAVVDGVAAAVRKALSDFVNAVRNDREQETGDIYIPIYLDGGIYDEIVVKAKERINFRSGGRADI